MAKPKQKWTSEEEAALSAGVEKHGVGRWRTILTDPQFASSLANRSNIDLKDKWRNLSGSDYGSSSRGSARTPYSQVIENLLLTYPEPSRRSADRKRRAPLYKKMIYEALSSIEDPNGIAANTMADFLEPKYELPKNFRRLLTSKLRRLEQNGELEMVNCCCYKVKATPSGAETPQLDDVRTDNVDNNEEQGGPQNGNEEQGGPQNGNEEQGGAQNSNEEQGGPQNGNEEQGEPQNGNKEQGEPQNGNKEQGEPQNGNEEQVKPFPTETPEDAASVAALQVSVAVNVEDQLIKTCEVGNTLDELLEESMAMLIIAEELYRQCSRDEAVILSP